MSRLVPVSSNPRRPLPAPLGFVLALAAIACCLLAAPGLARAGTIVADNGFRPAPNGFSFPNYGDEEGYANLDADQFERLYGPGVCLSGAKGGCVLTPVARAYMRAYNEGAAGGHCFGFATLAELVYKGYLPRFGYSTLAALGAGATTPFQLAIEGNTLLQRSIARAFNFQNLAAIQERTLIATPRQILNFLLHGGLDRSSPEVWTFEIFQYGLKAGHAITPYAVEAVGDGVYQVLVYDNNWPDDAGRRLEINTKKNTWSYYAMTVPGYPQAQYEGNAKSGTLRLAPVTPGLGVQACPFCVGRRGGGSKFNEVRLDGTGSEQARLLVTDAKGRRSGFFRGRLVNQIPGAKLLPRTSGGYRARPGGGLFADSPAPVIRVPRGADIDVSIDGRRLRQRDRETLSLVGPTYDATVENLIMGPRQRAEVNLSPHGNALSYLPTAKTVSPAISLGAQSRRYGYRVTVAALEPPRGSRLTFVKEPKRQLMWFGDDTDQRRRYRVTIERFGSKGTATFAQAVTIAGRQQAFLYYAPLGRGNGIAKIVVYRPGKRHHPVKVIPIKRGEG